MSFEVIKPDYPDQTFDPSNTRIFLAGSIDNGKASLWSTIIQDALKNMPVTIFNPRRDVWQSDLEARAHNAEFNYQVNWELDHLDLPGLTSPKPGCHVPFFYFEAGSVSPITLQELGFVIASRRGLMSGENPDMQKPVVVCPDGFWRKGNVEIMCSRHDIPIYNGLDEGIVALKIAVEVDQGLKALYGITD